jgi:hypothetical protein
MSAAPAVSLARATDNATSPGDLGAVHAIITGDTLADLTAACRAEADRDRRNAIKRKLPGFIAAGMFSARRRDAWQAASGLLPLDFDHVADLDTLRASLTADPCVALLFTSPSGDGIKACLRVPVDRPDPVEHARAFAAASRWAREIHGAELDPSGKDPARLCYLCHDPGALLRLDAAPLDLARWAPTEPVQAAPPRSDPPRDVPERDAVRRAAAYLDRLPPSIAGQGGHAALFRAAVALAWGFDLPDAEALPLMERFNMRADPPWQSADLARKLAEARTVQHREVRGWLLNADRPEDVRKRSGNGPDAEATSGATAAAFASERLLAERLASGPLRLALRFVPEGPAMGWRRWDGSTWAPSPEPVPVALAGAIHAEAGAMIAAGLLDLKTARALESTACMRAVLSQLQAREPMRFDMPGIDPPRSIATLGRLLDFDTGETQPATPDGPAFLHRCAVAYDPSATHPLWDSVAAHVAAMPAGDTVQRFLGASLVGIPPDRKLLVLTGAGGDGKGTLLRSCVAAAGGFGAVLPAEALSGDGRGAHGHEILAALGVARLAYASEVPPDLDWPLLKALSGGDMRTTKRMHGRAYTVQPRVWLALTTNDEPRVPDAAAADRVLLIRWQKPAESDPDIVGIIATPGPERDAYLRSCFAWLVRGAADFLRDGLGVPDFARPAVEPEGLAGWWSDVLEAGDIRPGEGWSPLPPIRASAADWHGEHGQPAPTDTALGCFLRSRLACKREWRDGRRVLLYRAAVDTVGHG